MDPVVLMQTAALASSISFLLPVSTPPNTVAFATGHVAVSQMVKAGIWLDVMAVVVITTIMTLVS
jgi:solute carrier family 13 (sodium-dependent dicarboxylate transporter), member 2/3/5